MEINIPAECVDCGKEFNYYDPNGNGRYYIIELRNESTRGEEGRIAYCTECAPFGNTSVPSKLGVE